MDKLKFLERLNQLIEEGKNLTNKSLQVKEMEPLDIDVPHYVNCHAWWLSCLNFLRSNFGVEHHFYTNFKKSNMKWAVVISKDIKQPIRYPKEELARAYAVLIYIKKEFELGLVADAQHLYEANLFSNLLEQAFELVEKDYLVGGAVHCRLIVENFINDLCRVKSIVIEESDKLPQKLTKLRKQGVIDLPLERVIQATYDVGTYAVHGESEFNKYTKDQILDILKTARDKILIIK